jgi:hypothetical protein
MNGMLFATYHFFTKLQMQHDNDAHNQQPTLAQIFLAGACCGLASTYVPFPPTKRKPKRMFYFYTPIGCSRRRSN